MKKLLSFKKTVHGSVSIEYRMPVGKSSVEMLAAFFLRLVIGLMSGIGVVYTALSFMPVSCNRFAAGLTALVCITLASICFTSKKLRLPSLTAFLLLLTAAVIYNYELLKGGFILTANSYFSLIHTAVPLTLTVPEGIENANLAATAFICTAVSAISLLIAIGTQWKSSLIIIFAATFPLFEMGMYYGMVPPYPMVILLIGSWIAILSVELSEMYAAQSESRVHLLTASSGILTFILVIIVFLAVFSVTSANGYTRPEKLNKLRNETILYMDDISVKKVTRDLRRIKAYLPQKTVGGINGGKLGQADEITFSGSEVLRVTLPADSEEIYLKGYSGSHYTGSSWERTELEDREKLSAYYSMLENTGFRPQLSTGSFWQLYEKGARGETVTIENISAGGKYFFVPYFSLPSEEYEGLEYVDDSFVLAGKDKLYSFRSFDGMRADVLGDADETLLSMPDLLSEAVGSGDYDLNRFNSSHKTYHSIIFSTCLDAGDMNSRLAYEVFGEEYFADTVPLYTFIADMRKYFSDNYTYSLKAGMLPEGEDFVRRFMSDSNKGSCTHFASAAVLLFRSIGIPARYAEGFVISSSDIASGEKNPDGSVTVSVPDSSAHAWAEIYIMDYGWIPVEMTPGYSSAESDAEIPENLPFDENAMTGEDVTEQSEQSEQSEETVTSETAASVMTAEQNEDAQTEEQAEAQTEAQNVSDAVAAESSGGQSDAEIGDDLFNPVPFIVLGCLLAASAAISGGLIYRRRFAARRRRRLILGSDTNAAVIEIYDYFIRLAGLLGYRRKPNSMSYSVYAQELEPLDAVLEGITASELVGLRMDADFSKDGADDRLRRAAAAAVMKFASAAGETLTPMQRLRYSYIENLL